MENNWSRHGRNSVTPVKQRRSGYEPSDAETEIPDSPWHGGKMRINVGLEYEGTKAELDLARNISPLKQSRHSSRIEYDGPSLRTNSVVSPVRRRNSSKSPYKPRRDDEVFPLSKSERRRHVSPFQAERGEHDLNGLMTRLWAQTESNSITEGTAERRRNQTTAGDQQLLQDIDHQEKLTNKTVMTKHQLRGRGVEHQLSGENTITIVKKHGSETKASELPDEIAVRW
ncbi:uncharacterized protein Pyn_01082 [Prunus yedoensis var. nudiflora]|uniref:Uncharacterized protein n=1 Tax=Prunus yedoensis var. nudiflora TaxID=2094558 RepID=A0A314XR74_PRUYE|nr:uncharacterized protein Pyn_01082 [Prunus yedoensis var. nudiflora]